MKTGMRLMLACAFLALAACDKEESAATPPPEGSRAVPGEATEQTLAATACPHCKWSKFENKEIPVDRVECTGSDNQKYHCHLITPDPDNKEVVRRVRVMEDQASGGFSFRLETSGGGQEANRMECENLVPNMYNARMIEGTCKILNAEHGPGVHHFRARIVPRDDGATLPDGTPWPEIVFDFRHTPFAQSAEGDPVHNGEGHVHLPGN